MKINQSEYIQIMNKDKDLIVESTKAFQKKRIL